MMAAAARRGVVARPRTPWRRPAARRARYRLRIGPTVASSRGAAARYRLRIGA
jgi:hypothetical protein